MPITLNTVAAATGLPPIGTGGVTCVSSGSGNEVGFQSQLIILPQDYVSGAPLADSDVWDNATFASLGLTPGSYAETFGTGVNAGELQINVDTLPAPEPAAAVLLPTTRCSRRAGWYQSRR
jgi:hypothetical protein